MSSEKTSVNGSLMTVGGKVLNIKHDSRCLQGQAGLGHKTGQPQNR